MTEINNTDFISLHWHYIVAGIICYISARFFYSFLGNKYDEAYGDRKNNRRFEINDGQNDGIGDEDDYNMDLQPNYRLNLKEVPLIYEKFPLSEMIERSGEFYRFMNMRRTVRHFSKETVPIEIIRNVIKTAGTAPSGAHTEPWTYVVVGNAEVKAQIREIIEYEEELNYMKRMGKKWKANIKSVKANWVKEYLTDAPYIILVFKQVFNVQLDGYKIIHYYNEMSINIATGMLLTAVHYAGLVSLTSTPVNCGPALRALLKRPNNEKLVLLLPVGFPAENCMVPDLPRKTLEEIIVEV